MKLHDWQKNASVRLVDDLRKHRKVVAVAPTGSGKTVIAAHIIRNLIPDAKVLWLAHRFELIMQARKELIAAGIDQKEIGVFTGKKRTNKGARILVSSVQMYQRGRLPDPSDLLVIDEAHRSLASTYKRVIDAHEGHVLGLTGTPWRLDGQPLGDTFDHLSIMASVTELEALELIAAPVTFGIKRSRARKLVSGASGGKDYSLKELGKRMSTKSLTGDTVAECNKRAPGQRTLVFAVNRQHGKTLTREFKRTGRTVEYLDGMTPGKERASILKNLDSGATEVVVNVDVLSEGYDCPAVKCIAIPRPTKSLSRFLQFCGRGARTYKGQRPIILDLAGNCWRHGLPNNERSELWTLDDEATSAGGEAPVRICPECGAMAPLKAAVCPECGAELKTDSERTVELTELERLEFEAKEIERRRSVLMRLGKERGKCGKELEAWVAKMVA